MTVYMNSEQVLIPRSLNCQMNFLCVPDRVHWRAQMISDSVSMAMNLLAYHGVLFHHYELKIRMTYLDP